MKKTTMLALALIFAFSAVSFADQATMSFADAKLEAAKLGKPLLVDFFTEW